MNFRRRQQGANPENPYNVSQASRIYFLPNLMTAGNLFCGFMAEPLQTTGAGVNEWDISPVELKTMLDAGETPFILDVREPNV